MAAFSFGGFGGASTGARNPVTWCSGAHVVLFYTLYSTFHLSLSLSRIPESANIVKAAADMCGHGVVRTGAAAGGFGAAPAAGGFGAAAPAAGGFGGFGATASTGA
jgi:hypothetical protein